MLVFRGPWEHDVRTVGHLAAGAEKLKVPPESDKLCARRIREKCHVLVPRGIYQTCIMSEHRIHLRPQLREAARRHLFHSPNLPHHHRLDLPRFANACIYGGAKYINRFHGLARTRVQKLCTSTAHLAFAENTNSLISARHRRLAAVVLISALGRGIAIRQLRLV